MPKLILLLLLSAGILISDNDNLDALRVVRIKYAGGGDWYGNKTTFVNLFEKIRRETGIQTPVREESAE